MKWVIVKESFLTPEIIEETTPKLMNNGQYKVRVSETNAKYLVGLKRYSLKEIRSLDNETTLEYQSRETQLELNQFSPFATNNLPTGEKITLKTHGVSKLIPAKSTDYIEFAVPYAKCLFNEVEIVEDVTMVLDFSIDLPDPDNDPSNNIKLEHHGINVNFGKTTLKKKSDYKAELFLGLVLNTKVQNTEEREKLVGLNYVFHEVTKDET